MEKQIKIIPPKGYEIDKENSTLECIKFKKKKDITYKDVAKELFFNSEKCYYTNSFGDTIESVSSTMHIDRFVDPHRATSKEQLHRILAINQLFNIAKYYNGNWEPTSEDRGYIIDCSPFFCVDGYHIGCDTRFMKSFPRFRNEEDAQAVIANPNFRPILDAIFK